MKRIGGFLNRLFLRVLAVTGNLSPQATRRGEKLETENYSLSNGKQKTENCLDAGNLKQETGNYSMRSLGSLLKTENWKLETVFLAVAVFLLAALPAWATPFAYINNSEGTISVIDTTTDRVIGSPIAVGGSLFAIAANPIGTKVYVTTTVNDVGAVVVIDTATNAVVGSPIPVGFVPEGIAINPATTKVYVANQGSGTVSVIDTLSNSVVATVAVGNYPVGIAVTPDGGRVYVAHCCGSNFVSVIDTATNTVIDTINAGSFPYGIAINPTGTKVYVTDNGGGNVTVIDTAANAVTDTIAAGSYPFGIALNPSGSKVYVANRSGTVSVIDTSTNMLIHTIPVASYPSGIAVNPSGTKVYVANAGSNSVSVIDTSTDTVVGTISVGTGPMAFGTFIISKGVNLPRTGQTTSYAAGDDGAIQAGIAWPNPRFTDNGDQTVTDNLTGLIWTKDAGTPTFTGAISSCTGGTMNWQAALDYVACLNSNNYLGHNDWRLPNVNEFESIVNNGQSYLETWLNGQGFINVGCGHYWSSTSFAMFGSAAWRIYGCDGFVAYSGKDSSLSVWPVRGGQGASVNWRTGQTTCYDSSGSVIACAGSGQDGELQKGVSWPSPRFSDNGDQSVTDNLTNLIWTKSANAPGPSVCNPGTYMTWQGALNYVACLNSNNYLGHNDWRLPNRIELYSIIDFSQDEPSIPTSNPFNSVQFDNYWSSTSSANGGGIAAWLVNMNQGNVDHGLKTFYYYVWPVRGGQSGPFDNSVILSVSQSGSGSGTITSAPSGINCGSDCSETYDYNTSVTLTASASTGSTFVGWSGDCSGTASTLDVTMLDRDMTCTATFTLIADTTPDPFTFTDQTGVALNTQITSNVITISGINTPSTISITGGEYSINGGVFTSASGTVNNGDTVSIRLTSSNSYSTTTTATLSIGGISDTFSVTTMAVANSFVTQLTTDPASEDSAPDFSHDGSKIVFVSNRSGNANIWVMDADGSNPIELTTDPARDYQPHWSPDGSQIVFKSDRGGNSNVWVMNADGTNQVQLTFDLEGYDPFDAYRTYGADWSPDGLKIVFDSRRTGSYDIWIMNSDGSGQTQLTTDQAYDAHPSFSPDGSKIVFISDRTGNNDIWVMNVDGSGQIQLTNTSEGEGHPHFSPDGSKIVFWSTRTGNREVWIMNVDGSDQTQVTDDPADDGGGNWSPDGTKIVFKSNRAGNNDIWIYQFDTTPAPTTYTVTPSAGANGSISPSTPQVVSPNATPSFTITPDTGYHIATVGGTCAGMLSANIFSTAPITADCTVSVSFAADTADNTVTSGNGVTVTPAPEAMLTFDTVSTGGTAIVTEILNPTALGNFNIVGGTSYDITFTGTFTGPVTVCFNYDPASVNGSESNLKLMHRTTTGWEDITSPGYPDIINHIICGVTMAFSEFAVVEPIDAASAGGSMYVTTPGQADTACVSYMCNGTMNNGYKLNDASSPSAAEGGALYIYWGDGTPIERHDPGGSFMHTYNHIGQYRVTQTVTDENGNKSQQHWTVNVSAGTTGKGTLIVSASGSAHFNIGYKVMDGNTTITTGTIAVGGSKSIILDAKTYTVKFTYQSKTPLTDPLTYHSCSTLPSGAVTSSNGSTVTVSNVTVPIGGTVSVSLNDCNN